MDEEVKNMKQVMIERKKWKEWIRKRENLILTS